jgi:hypothetical protein
MDRQRHFARDWHEAQPRKPKRFARNGHNDAPALAKLDKNRDQPYIARLKSLLGVLK